MNQDKSKITLKDIAEKAGASISVVSRTLRNKPTSVLISEETKSKILETAIEMGWRRNNNIGIIVPGNVSSSDYYFLPCLAGMFHEANKYGNGIFIEEYSSSDTDKIEIPEFISQKEISGVVLMHTVPQNIREYLEREKIPFIVVNPLEPCDKNCIVLDDYGLFMDLLLHLKNCGYKDYYYISYDTGSNYTREAVSAFDNFIAENKFSGKKLLGQEDFVSEIQQEVSSLIKNAFPEMVFISEARFWTVKLLELFMLHGKSCPNNAGLVGHPSIAEVYIPRLTTIKQPFFEMGKSAIQMVNDLWDNKNHPINHLVLKGELIIGNSCRKH
jgi:LacI family transcriptional regulator